jgi:hypothetical protein
MSDTLFSSFLMVDQPLAPVGRRQSHDGARKQERQARELLVMAFLRALQETAPGVAASPAATSAPLADLAAAAADIALVAPIQSD